MHMETATHSNNSIYPLIMMHANSNSFAFRNEKNVRNEHLHVVRTHTRCILYLVFVVELRTSLQRPIDVQHKFQVMNVTIAVYTAEHDIKIR